MSRYTVYDASSLASRKSKSASHLPSELSQIVDPRGNRIYHDTTRIPKLRSLDSDYRDSGHEEISIDDKNASAEETLGNLTEAPRRLKKRRKYNHDPGFLGTIPVLSLSSEDRGGYLDPLPSSDLLKSVHHYTCEYYSKRGQLYNASRSYRQSLKKRRMAGSTVRATASGQEPREEEEEPEEEEEEEDEEDDDDDEISGSEDGDDGPLEETRPEKDMYKSMDGSALLALGMLLEEHVKSILIESRSIPHDHAEQDEP